MYIENAVVVTGFVIILLSKTLPFLKDTAFGC